MSFGPLNRNSYRLPELRQDLQLHEGPRGENVRSWIVYDPLRHRYFQISRHAFNLLVHWRPIPAGTFATDMEREFGIPVSSSDVDELVKFLVVNNLTIDPPGHDARSFAQQSKQRRRGGLRGLLHTYLFFKIPLVDPTRFLAATHPMISPLFSRAAAWLITVVGVCGFYLASRQWDRFSATFIDFLNFEGAISFGLTLALVKTLHELGHAYAATRASVRVNSMGIAFMVMTPMLYTDVSDAWRLRDRRDKIAIDCAGMVVEIALAAIALFLWSFLQDGSLRSAAFMLATTSLIMGIGINLNPLMRFDGYHILADAWRVPNLQDRSTALCVWWMREVLFQLGRPPPEHFAPRQQRLLIAYAVCVWAYRFALFVGIALIVYHAFFKALGVVLFLVEIAWFILLPIYREMKEWWNMREAIILNRRFLFTTGVAIAGIAALLLPWSGTIKVQGVIIAENQLRLFAPRPGRIKDIAIRDQQKVAAGDVAVIVSAPELEHDIVQAHRQIALSQARLARIAGDDADRADRVILEVELARNTRKLAGLEEEMARLVIRVPANGVIRDLDRDLQIGDWIDDNAAIARVVNFASHRVFAYVEDQDLWRIATGAQTVFIPEDPLGRRRTGKIVDVSMVGIHSIEQIYLASVYGGAIPADRTHDGQIKPRSGRHLVQIQVDGAPLERAERGYVHIDGIRESIAASLVRRVLQVLVRESSA